MKKLKALILAFGAVAVTGSALAVPTLIISDGVTSTSLANASGIVNYVNGAFDGTWSVVISTGETKPALGSATSPQFDLNIQATSLLVTPTHTLTISFSDNNFGPVSGSLLAQLSGHVVSGNGQTVTYNTYFDTGNSVGATTTSLTSSGNLSAPTYASSQTGSLGSQPGPFSLTQIVTVAGTLGTGGQAGASYSLDASLSGVPDGGTTVMLLGAALSGLAFFRRKMA